ncbi:hypothetical protein CL655_02770 [bacterium]|nr:hypothetical protein [bacterium]|tara:strand:+ start:512 stop:1390 length:879 start_codon:yes stop_codon:yes gene_type:complete
MNLQPIEALGTVWHIELFEEVSDPTALRRSMVDWLEEYESRYSRFRSESWLSQLNRTGVFSSPDEQFVDLLTQALHYYQSTEGVFNIAIGEQLTKSGYDANYTFTATAELPPIPPLPEILEVSAEKISLQSGSLDLGGIGKGYAIDALAAFLREEHNLQYFLINGGGDMYVTSDKDTPVTILLAHPDDRSLAIGTLELKNAGFAASSPRLRAWHDPKTGKLHNHLLTKHNVASYVVAPTTTEADVWATVSCLNQTIETPANIHQLLISESGHVIKDTFIYLADNTNYTLYKK